jgi:hypothetical protein
VFTKLSADDGIDWRQLGFGLLLQSQPAKPLAPLQNTVRAGAAATPLSRPLINAAAFSTIFYATHAA